MKIEYVAPITMVGGYGEAARGTALALLRAGHEVQVRDPIDGYKEAPNTAGQLSEILDRAHSFQKPDLQIVHAMPPAWSVHLRRGTPFIGLTAWETDRLPHRWLRWIDDARPQDIWVPTTFCADVFRASGLGSRYPITVIPHPHDCDRILSAGAAPLDLAQHGVAPDHKVVLFVGQWNARKNPEAAFAAFARTFSRGDKVSLVLKTWPPDDFRGGTTEARAWVSKQIHRLRSAYGERHAHVVGIVESLGFTDLMRLYASADVLLHPSRGEGWGLPVSTAMLLGVPAIVGQGSGPDDFVSDDNGYPVSTSYTPAGMANYPWFDAEQLWLEPNVLEICDALSDVVHGGGAEKRSEAAKQIRDLVSLDTVANKMTESIEAVEAALGACLFPLPRARADSPDDDAEAWRCMGSGLRQKSKAIVLFAHARPDLLKKTLASVSRLLDLDDYDVWGVVDGPRIGQESAQESCIQLILDSGLVSETRLLYYEANQGIGIVTFVAYDRLFCVEGYGEVVAIEDDIDCTADALRRLSVLRDDHGSPGIYGLFSPLVTENTETREGVEFIFASMDREAWHAVNLYWQAYTREFLLSSGRAYTDRDHDAIKAAFSEDAQDPDFEIQTSRDGAIRVAARLSGVPLVSTTRNYAIHTGVHGEHMTPKLYRELHHDTARLWSDGPQYKPDGLYTCSDADPGQMAFLRGLASFGFESVPLDELSACLATGAKVLLHGWGADYADLGARHPGQVFCLWHSGWTGSDLMCEGEALGQAMEAQFHGHIQLLWLDGRDAPPIGTTLIKPVWSADDLFCRATQTPAPRRVVVGLHGAYPAPAKNSLAAIAACCGLGAELHISKGAINQSNIRTIRTLLSRERHTIHDQLPYEEVRKLLLSAEVLVHPSVSDTWPYLVMEAIYAGLPVVLSRVVGLSAYLSRPRDCVVSPPTATQQIRKLTEALLDNAELRQRVSEDQLAALESLRPRFMEETRRALQQLGFPVAAYPPL
jgi:glycosyltransferase involved in cell wall biosynthesis